VPADLPQPHRIAIAVNPTSGAGRGRRLGAQVGARLAASGHELVDVAGTSAAECLDRSRAAVARGLDAFVVVGGDGMVNLGANAVAGTDVPLGIVAAGTGNDIAASLGLPVHDVAASLSVLEAGLAAAGATGATGATADGVRRIDAVQGTANGGPPRWFVGVLCGGFDALVNERANGWSWPRGRMRYNLAIARELPLFHPLPYELELDGEPWRTEAVLVAVGNGTRYGGGMRITPDAVYDDGLVDVLVAGPLSRSALMRVFPRVFDGSHVTHPAVTIRRARRVRLSTPGVVAYADGERFGAMPVDLRVVPGALRILAAASTGASDPAVVA
jgi:diacylglycerol kinase (ATP)